MNIREFADKYRVKMAHGRQGVEDTIPGRYGEIAEDFGNGFLRLRLLATPRHATMNGALNSRKKQAEVGGLKPISVSPNIYESIWAFDPENTTHCRLAIDLVASTRRRTVVLDDSQRAALAARLAVARASRGLQAAA